MGFAHVESNTKASTYLIGTPNLKIYCKKKENELIYFFL